MRYATAAVLGCLIFSAHAEMFKCKQPDGTFAFQDFACGTSAPGPAKKLPVPQTLPQTGGNQGGASGNQSCAQENVFASGVCSSKYNETISKCVASTLSPICAKQFQGPVDKHDDACNREIPQRLRQCLPAANAFRSQCVASNLSAKCRQP